MIALLWFLLTLFASPLKSKSRVEAENAALRYQLIVLRRKVRGRIRLTNGDRLVFIQLYRWFPSMLQVITIIRPETLVRWHRAGFRQYWRWKSRSFCASTMSSSWARRICAGSCKVMPAITTRSGRTGHWIKMRRSPVRFSRPEALNRTLSLVDFITITFESRFSVRTTPDATRCPTMWKHRHNADPVRIASSLRPDMIFRRDRLTGQPKADIGLDQHNNLALQKARSLRDNGASSRL